MNEETKKLIYIQFEKVHDLVYAHQKMLQARGSMLIDYVTMQIYGRLDYDEEKKYIFKVRGILCDSTFNVDEAMREVDKMDNGQFNCEEIHQIILKIKELYEERRVYFDIGDAVCNCRDSTFKILCL